MIESLAAIADGQGTFAIETIHIDTPRSDEVLVKVKATGICHTDWDSMSWGKPLVMGHEGAGEVVAVGDAVSTVSKGDHVILNWAVPCYNCFQCKKGNQHLCEINSAVISGNKVSKGHANLSSTLLNDNPIEKSFNLGTMSEYTLVREAACVKIDKHIPFSSASIIGCGVMTGFGSVVNCARVKAGDSLVVIGTGGVGLNIIQTAKITGAERIIAIDINPLRLKMAKEYGATHTIHPTEKDLDLIDASEVVKSLTEGRGADYAFECTGVPKLGSTPLLMVRNAGTAIQVSGIEEEINFDMNLFEWDKKYINPLYGQSSPQRDFPKIIDLYQQGSLELDRMISNTYSLKDLGMAFDDMHSGTNAKGVIVFE